ncbi:MAG: peptidase family protein [Ilumatobacteraceae bacterium]|nr:peptidase family protein [Ilumatobacteraceae bacterium]
MPALARRHVESSALTALLPALAVAPLWLAALFLIWLPVHVVWHVPFGWFALGYLLAGVVLFLRPVQVRLVAPLLGARRPTRSERALLDTSWRSVLQANRLPRGRYALAVLPADDLNAFACGGHLVIVTSFAIETLPRDELAGVLAHELSHHLGFHTVALTIAQWLSMPVLLLARIGFFLQNVATAATDTFARQSTSLTALGRFLSAVLTVVSWPFLAGLGASNAIGNVVGRNAEFQADRRVVAMGFGKPLASALRRVVTTATPAEQTWRERLSTSHPPARTRVARIEALLRQRRP